MMTGGVTAIAHTTGMQALAADTYNLLCQDALSKAVFANTPDIAYHPPAVSSWIECKG